MTAVDKLLSIALAEEGYCEKKTNSNLDDKTANAGNGNYTKYARDLVNEIGAPYAQGVAWCDMFVDWCFVQAFGAELTKKMLNGYSAYTPTSADYYKRAKRWYNKPQKGDQIFFQNGSRINHTGIVVDVNENAVITVEGNSSNKVQVRRYNIKGSNIAGYGRPYYGLALEEKPVSYDTVATVNGVDISEALDPNVFDVKKYRNAFKDLDSAYGDNWVMYYWHFAISGKTEIENGKRASFM